MRAKAAFRNSGNDNICSGSDRNKDINRLCVAGIAPFDSFAIGPGLFVA
jgi:hypothetical protein